MMRTLVVPMAPMMVPVGRSVVVVPVMMTAMMTAVSVVVVVSVVRRRGRRAETEVRGRTLGKERRRGHLTAPTEPASDSAVPTPTAAAATQTASVASSASP